MSTITTRRPNRATRRGIQRDNAEHRDTSPTKTTKRNESKVSETCDRTGIRIAKTKKIAKPGYWSGLFAGTRDF